jgi:hypothetical protein
MKRTDEFDFIWGFAALINPPSNDQIPERLAGLRPFNRIITVRRITEMDSKRVKLPFLCARRAYGPRLENHSTFGATVAEVNTAHVAMNANPIRLDDVPSRIWFRAARFSLLLHARFLCQYRFRRRLRLHGYRESS